MSCFKKVTITIGLLLSVMASAAHAQWAVIDVNAIAQLARQLVTMQQQLATLQNQLRQAQQEYGAITGNRGMQNLLLGINRNYLPTDWGSLMAAVTQVGHAYPQLEAGVQNSINANAVLTPAQIAALSAPQQAQLLSDRQTVAMLEATVQQALVTTSGRFASLQQLIAALGGAHDAKGSMDLQARIAAEEAMVGNDQTKLGVLYQAAEAQLWVQQQRVREQAIADLGSLRALPAMGL